jgi:hypothetical protein
MLQQFVMNFCLDNELIDKQEKDVASNSDQVEMDGEE